MNDELPWWRRAYGAPERASFGVVLETGWIMRSLAAPRLAEVDGRILAPEMAAMLRLDDIAHRSDLRGLPPEKARSQVASGIVVVDDAMTFTAEHRDLEYPGPDGTRRIRCYEPIGITGPSPAVVYFHGGGWVTGSIGTHDNFCRRLATGASCRVFSVDYRLAPEHRFPAAALDCEAAFRWVSRSSDTLGVDPKRIAVAGDSAGGNLSAVVAQLTHDAAHPPCLAVLLYPALDMTARMRSHESVGDKYFLTLEMIEWYYAHYMGEADRRDPRASPSLAASVPRVPTLIYTCGFDPLRDEGRAYADRLEAAGVRCEYVEYPDLLHGFALMTKLPAARRAADQVVSDVRRWLGTP
jgi:acetyl esterase